jgi:hypothetical protein
VTPTPPPPQAPPTTNVIVNGQSLGPMAQPPAGPVNALLGLFGSQATLLSAQIWTASPSDTPPGTPAGAGTIGTPVRPTIAIPGSARPTVAIPGLTRAVAHAPLRRNAPSFHPRGVSLPWLRALAAGHHTR